MNETLLFTILTLTVLGGVAAVILYFVAQKFKVYEDPRIDDVEKMLPGANCGGCGYPGCRGLADALVKNDDISQLNCPVGGAETMKSIAAYLGKVAPEREPQIAVVRCAGTCAQRPKTSEYNGIKKCSVAASLFGGETNCSFGCIGFGDCVTVCNFDAISINPETGLPEIDEEKCTACGACAKACPKMVIEIRKKGPRNRRIFVSCINKDKGAVARKACKSACIGCGKCVKTCPFGAITLENNVAYIDYNKCKLCRKCVAECPTGAIMEVNFPIKPVKPAEPKPQVAKPAAKTAETTEEAKPVVKPVTEKVVETAKEAVVEKPTAETTVEVKPTTDTEATETKKAE